jgi:hypothetical protein
VAGFECVAAVGRSLERLLTACFAEQPVPVPGSTTTAVLARAEDMKNGGDVIAPPALSIFLYKVDVNKTMRAAWSGVGSVDGRAHLALDLHYLLTPWAENAVFEHLILGRTLQCLEDTPILSGPLLYATPVANTNAAWAPNEGVQLVHEELTTDTVLRTFDSLPIDYKISLPFVARVVRLDGRRLAEATNVTAAVLGATPSPVP